LISRHARINGLELSREIGITERAVRKVIANLETAGYINKNKEGRCIRYRINPDLTLRHKTHQEVAIGDFLQTLGWKVEE
jgi:predicted transcriptional regulator